MDHDSVHRTRRAPPLANLVTLSRLPLLLTVIWLACRPPGWWQVAGTVLLILVFVMDGLDGYIARRRGECSPFGAMLDIALDRVVELALWTTFAGLGLAPLWVVLVFLVRGALVDAIRASAVAAEGTAPFEALRHPLAVWLVAGRFMRGFYAAIKAITFCWLLAFSAVPTLLAAHAPPSWMPLWEALAPYVGAISSALIWTSVALCLARGLPVIVESARMLRPMGGDRRQHG